MILLDTHTVIWVVSDHPRLGSRARKMIQASPGCYVSAVTHIELAIKSGRNKILLPDGFRDHLADAGFERLALEDRHASAMNRFPALDGHDPFDRMLVAQAVTDNLTFLTADRTLLALDLPWIIDATR